MVIKLYKNKEFDKYFMLGANHNLMIDKICAMLFAMLPLLQHYQGLYRNSGFTVLILLFPILIYRGIIQSRNKCADRFCIRAVIPLLIFEVYTVFIHGVRVNETIYAAFMFSLFFLIAYGTVNARFVFRSAVFIAKLASVAIILQYATYYLLGFHICMIPVDWLLEGSDIWIGRALYGVNSVGEMYRPSAFFLEPSHLFLYTFPLLSLLLILPDMDSERMKDALIISLGLLLSTSGFGIVAIVLCWGSYYMLYRKGLSAKQIIKKVFSLRTIVVLIVIIVFLTYAYYYIPFISRILFRIFDFRSGNSVAVSGRVKLANDYIRSLSGRTLLTGVSRRTEIFEFNMAGFHATLYKWGFFGIFFTYWFYMQGLFKLKGPYFYITAIILVISFFSAHTHGTFYMMYYALILINGYFHVPDTNTEGTESGKLKSIPVGGV